MKKPFKILLWVFVGFVLIAVALDICIRHERKLLQARAKEFLSRPVPQALNTNSLGSYVESRNGNVLIRSRSIIERYAKNGRIRWSAAIQAEYAVAPFGISACEDVIKTNNEARAYVADCRSILDTEWRMGFWQWIEDTIELKQTIPEHEEEDMLARSSK